jgi:hypothetical protein
MIMNSTIMNFRPWLCWQWWIIGMFIKIEHCIKKPSSNHGNNITQTLPLNSQYILNTLYWAHKLQVFPKFSLILSHIIGITAHVNSIPHRQKSPGIESAMLIHLSYLITHSHHHHASHWNSLNQWGLWHCFSFKMNNYPKNKKAR